MDNGVRQEVSEVSYGTRPIDMTVALDVSESVTGAALEDLRRACRQLAADLKPGDRLKLLVFRSDVHRILDFTADAKAVETALRGLPAGGRTALYDTISTALLTAADPARRQLVVVLSDGRDTGSITAPGMLQVVADRSRATLTLLLSSAVTIPGVSAAMIEAAGLSVPFGRRPADPMLASLVAQTGGDVFGVDDSGGLSMAFRRALSQFRSSYVLFYSPKGVDKSGFHTIKVTTERPDTIVQARRGYFGG
jgi:VWFA-related protein